jgi:S1-C subfamily serine protease
MSDNDHLVETSASEETSELVDLDAARSHPVSEPWPTPADDDPTRRTFWEPPAEPLPKRAGAGTRATSIFLAALLGAGLGGTGAYLALDGGSGVATVRVPSPVQGASTGSTDAAARVAAAVLPSIVQVEVAGAFGEGGQGSGVIYAQEGYIVTNDHVVAGAEEIQVVLPDGARLAAALVGTARTVGVDVAVLKVVPDEPLTAAVLGDASKLRVGELAVAIGSPFGLQSTVTSGIISALNRNENLGGVRFTNAIQTDAAINQGNSGGALANANGEVIGINSVIISGTGGNVGLGFAIPIDIVRKVADQIIEDGRAQLPFLGILGDNLPESGGARVREVEPGTPAARAGLRADDVIVRFGGETVTSMDQLISLILQKNVGDEIEVVVLRDGREVSLRVTLATRRS